MSEPIKLCKDCAHFRLPWWERILGGYIFGDCAKHFLNIPARTDLTDGRRRSAYRLYRSAAFFRIRIRESDCGPEGKLWEPRR